MGALLNAHTAPYTLHPTHPTPYTLRPAPYTLHITPYSSHPRQVRNLAGLTPFTLAAEHDNQLMFRHIYEKHREVSWEYGHVACYMMPLLGC